MLRPLAATAAAAALASATAASAAPVHQDLQYIDFAPKAAPQFTLMMLNDTTRGSACIDGSPYGVYVSPGQGVNANNWMIYFQGGGWCYDAADCAGRANTTLGSSTKWATAGSMSGALSNSCDTNPVFCNHTKVWMAYCDGTSFSSMLEGTVPWNTQSLHFRGHANLLATMDAITSNSLAGLPAWENAYDIVLTGCSAGGLATFLHADFVGANYANTTRPPPAGSGLTRNGRYFVMPISGFFLDAPNVVGERVYTEEIATIFALSNSSGGVNQACVAAQPSGSEHLCMMAEYAYAYTTSRIFPLNSFYDSWSTGCVLTAEPVADPNNPKANGNCSAVPGWAACAGNPDSCTNDEISAYQTWRSEFGTKMNGTTTAAAAGNGGFLVSCHTHCEAQSDQGWAEFTVNGVAMRDAVAAWLAADPSAPSSDNFHWDCEYNTDAPRTCNPTCG